MPLELTRYTEILGDVLKVRVPDTAIVRLGEKIGEMRPEAAAVLQRVEYIFGRRDGSGQRPSGDR